MVSVKKTSALSRFSPATRAWFGDVFEAATPAQLEAWDAITAGRDALVVAPTGSGKTLAAFLWALDKLATTPPPDDPKLRCRVLYVSPLKALAVDVERNLRAPLIGIRETARRLGEAPIDVEVAVRSGDTPANERRRFATRPSDVLITTPESLFLLLTSQGRESLRGVETVIIDEVHAVAGTKRGAHLALTLERLDTLLPQPAQRIGLSATVRPVEEVARFLGGERPVTVVQPKFTKQWDLSVVVPVEDMAELAATEVETSGSAAGPQQHASIWPHVEEHVFDLISQHSSTIVFSNSRRLAERLTARLNEIAAERAELELPELGSPAQLMAQSGGSLAAPPLIARAHHGSVSKEQRALIEADLKSGRLPCVVATSSLELGIDMGAVDLVIQVEAPPSVASGLQRVGRAGHQVGAVSRGVLFPKFRGDLIDTAVVVQRMRDGLIESLHIPANPLDVLAQQIVSIVALDSVDVDELFSLVRRCAPFATLPRSAYDGVLDMLSGRYPSDEFAELRPRIVFDRVSGEISGRPGAQRLAVTSGGTIPDRGLFGVFLVGESTNHRVGELDEEMVYESRVGDVFTLGASSWRIEDITHDRVLVSPAPGQPGRLPFWKGDAVGRPAELGAATGAFVRKMASLPAAKAIERARTAGLDEYAANNLVSYLAEQRDATSRVPDDVTIVVERFRDELGDWRVCVHSPYGGQVHGPWALAIAARLRDRYGMDAQSVSGDDGIVLRLPETDEPPPGADLVLFDPADIEDLVTTEVGGSALFAARFRECAARALLLPRRNPGRRSPLWQQRQRASQLLSVASKFGSFPIVLETLREVLQDVYDLPALKDLLTGISERRISVVEVETSEASPFAKSLLFGYVGAFMYEGDSPLAEKRAAALSLDQSLLAELLGRTELRELLDAEVVLRTEAELQRLAEDRRARDAEGLFDVLRIIGPLSLPEATQRSVDGSDAESWLTSLAAARRVVRVRIAGEHRWAVVEDVARLRDALGVPLPPGVAEAHAEPVADPLGDLVSRYARTHGPFRAIDLATHLGIGVAVVTDALRRLGAAGRVVEGEFLPGGIALEWCDSEVLRLLRRRSLAALRKEVEPVDPSALARFLPAWQGITSSRGRGYDVLLGAIEQLAGCAVPASALESIVLPSRVPGYQPSMLDELTATGEVVWAGSGSLPGTDGWVSLHLADNCDLTLPDPDPAFELGETHQAVLDALSGGGAFFFRQLSDVVGSSSGAIEDETLVGVLWDLVWAGYLTNDTLTPVRSLVGGGRGSHRTRRATPRARPGRPMRPGRPAMPSRSGPPTAGGRWSLLPARSSDATRRAHAAAETLLDRYGIVTRGSVITERTPGGFAAVYKVLSAFEESGRCRRGYFVAGLGAAQFALPGAVDRLRALAELPTSSKPDGPFGPPGRFGPGGARTGGAARGRKDEELTARAVVLAASDPANPYGAALPWPERESAGGHRPGRKAGALVVMVDGQLIVYVERGGRTVLSFTEDPDLLQPAVDALALSIRDGQLGKLSVETADGEQVRHTAFGDALAKAGFHATPRGLRLRA
ncbi:Lhr family ATP dependent helicase [Kribbella sp. VKM Ac-2569]|uniref:ATP-dependent helicase n=1 Tax=Kribbella sp. VKM Ac-2569 TaxID=2512220 RepID=UPI00102AB454|nr:ATP-dependent helicase [Kribbella sp. VKM Ac-2569]RZT26534.1 Lhr family ATP dependent helicase [Kribbella sp. VKM Ac-2569]